MASTAVNSETSVPTPSVNAKPLTPAVASMNRMNATPIVTTFASMIVAQRLRVAGGDRRRDRAPGARLLLDSLEDDDVGVGRHAEREDHAGDARQRQRDRDQLDQREEQDRVDEERDAGDHAEHAVEHDQEQQRRARGRRRRRAGPGRAPACRAWPRPASSRSASSSIGSAPISQALGEVLRLLDREAALDLGAGRGRRCPPGSRRSRSSGARRSRCRA